MKRLALVSTSLFVLAVVPLAYAQEAPATTRVELDRPGTALQATETWASWHTYWTSRNLVCNAPCTAVVPLDRTYRVVGIDMPPSSSFSLPPSDRVMLSVRPGNRGAHDAGAFLTILGGASAFGGAMVLLASEKESTTIVGLAVLGAGVVLAAVGIPMLVSNGTVVHFD